MFHILALVPLLFFIGTSFFYNHNKLNVTKPYFVMVSLFEAVISYLITYLLYLEGFFTHFYQYLLFFLFIFILSYILFLFEKDLDNDMDLQIETIKNNLITFFVTLAPFYLFLTIFRFQPTVLQIVFSGLISVGVFSIYIVLRNPFNAITEKITMFIADATANIFLLLWGLVVGFVLLITLFDFPLHIVRQELHLSDNVSYFSFDGFPTDLDNNFQLTESFQITLDQELGESLVDYYIQDTYLYLYANTDSLYTIDIETGDILYSDDKLGVVSDDGSMSFNQITNLFFKAEGDLFLLSRSGLYMISPNSYQNISPYKATDSKLFYHEDTPYLLRTKGAGLYDVYEISNQEVVFKEEIDANTQNDFTSLSVISERLFKTTDTTYSDYYNSQYSFTRINSSPIYDEENHVLYSTYFNEGDNETTYYQGLASGKTNELTLSKLHNRYGIVANGFAFFAEQPDESFGRIEIMNQDFNFQGIVNHRTHTNFWVGNQYYTSYIVNYLNMDDELTYLHTDQNSKETLLTLYTINEVPDLTPLPFYSYFGLYHFLPIIVFLFIPLSNFRREITFIGFDHLLKKKN